MLPESCTRWVRTGSGRMAEWITTPSGSRRGRERPKLIIAGASAYPRILDFEAFADIAREVGALLMVDMAHIAGLVAADLHPSPIPHSDVVTTTTHKTLRGPRGGIVLSTEEHRKAIDKAVFPGTQGGASDAHHRGQSLALKEALEPSFKEYARQIVKNASALGGAAAGTRFQLGFRRYGQPLDPCGLPDRGELTGKDAERALEEAGITVNKNTVPGEQRSPFVTSGLRIGLCPHLEGMRESEMRTIGDWIADILEDWKYEELRVRVRSSVRELTRSFPFIPSLAVPPDQQVSPIRE